MRFAEPQVPFDRLLLTPLPLEPEIDEEAAALAAAEAVIRAAEAAAERDFNNRLTDLLTGDRVPGENAEEAVAEEPSLLSETERLLLLLERGSGADNEEVGVSFEVPFDDRPTPLNQQSRATFTTEP